MESPRFDEIESDTYPLWDFGWLLLSRFAVHGGESPDSPSAVLARFVASPIYRRSFCESEDSWNADIDRHGPYLAAKLSHSCFRELTPEEFRSTVKKITTDPAFDSPPTEDQLSVLDDWVNSVTQSGSEVFYLSPEHGDVTKVEWAKEVWLYFQEYIAVSKDGQEVQVAVVGYD